MLGFINKKKAIFNYLCAGLLLVLFVLYFIPYWNTGTSVTSIAKFLWWDCANNTDLMSWFAASTKSAVNINIIIIMPVVMFLLSIISAVVSVIAAKHPFTVVLSAVCGVCGIYGYLATPYLPLGSTWQLHLAICIAVTVISVALIIAEIAGKTKKAS